MLRCCEIDLRREAAKTQAKPGAEHESAIHTTKKVTLESDPIPHSPVKNAQPKSKARFSPRKTHLTNFMNQNMMYADLLRKQHGNMEDTSAAASISTPNEYHETKMKRSPCLQFNELGVGARKQVVPPKSPMPRRRFSGHSPRDHMDDTDSDSDVISAKSSSALKTKEKNSLLRNEYGTNANGKAKRTRTHRQHQVNDARNPNKSGEISYIESNARYLHSIDLVNRYAMTHYCPLSEPVKRKIYAEKPNDRFPCSIDMETGIVRTLTIIFNRVA